MSSVERHMPVAKVKTIVAPVSKLVPVPKPEVTSHPKEAVVSIVKSVHSRSVDISKGRGVTHITVAIVTLPVAILMEKALDWR